jgi:hypothetical protein
MAQASHRRPPMMGRDDLPSGGPDQSDMSPLCRSGLAYVSASFLPPGPSRFSLRQDASRRSSKVHLAPKARLLAVPSLAPRRLHRRRSRSAWTPATAQNWPEPARLDSKSQPPNEAQSTADTSTRRTPRAARNCGRPERPSSVAYPHSASGPYPGGCSTCEASPVAGDWGGPSISMLP